MSYKPYTGGNAPFYELGAQSADIVNLAIDLGRPLLVEGEAGCGKTKLAAAIAYELDLGQPVYVPVKSTSQAKDLLYHYDALRRLQDSQNPDRRDKAWHVYPYIRLQPLGRAILEGKASVILIDEVDKADIDFPNDLLDVLEAFTFEIEDLPTDERTDFFQANRLSLPTQAGSAQRPIVVITSNREKPLPEPFLRRCIYLELRFPEQAEVLAGIVRKNLGVDLQDIPEDLLRAAVEGFLRVRKEATDRGAKKPPATSELIDWVKVLLWRRIDAETIHEKGARPPYFELLLKTMHDLRIFQEENPGASA